MYRERERYMCIYIYIYIAHVSSWRSPATRRRSAGATSRSSCNSVFGMHHVLDDETDKLHKHKYGNYTNVWHFYKTNRLS